jgi:hypothetical protein
MPTTTSTAALDRDTLERIAIMLQSNPRIQDRSDMLEMVRSIQSGRCDDYHWTQQALSAALARSGVEY